MPNETLVSHEDMYVLLYSSVRYAVGRTSYITGVTSEIVLRHKHCLTAAQRKNIADEVEEELRRGHGGHDCDVKAWRELISGLRE